MKGNRMLTGPALDSYYVAANPREHMDVRRVAMDEFWRQCTTLPPASKRAVDLTGSECVALAYAAGVPCELQFRGTLVWLATTRRVAITDREGGGFVVAIEAENSSPCAGG